ncbi:MAG: SPFH domain-containing protein [Lentisphaeria bacterium]|jgi:flotillin
MPPVLLLIGSLVLVFFATLIAFAARYKRCPSDKILVVYGKVSGAGRPGLAAKCYHGGGTFVIPIIQDYQYLDLTPIPIEIKLEGALSLQNIRVNTPSTFTVGVSTEPGVMENAAERLLGLDLAEIQDLARDIIFGQMRVVIATMRIEEINSEREKLLENISTGVEVELKKIGLRLINVNVQDITDESGYIQALGQEAAARAINEAKIKVADQTRAGEIGKALAERDQRVEVAAAMATAVEGENTAGIKVAQSNAARREKEAEATRLAVAAELVKEAEAKQEAYVAEETAERQRAKREEATQYANIVVPAEIERRRIETIAEADAEKIRRLKKGEADGIRAMMEAEAAGLLAILEKKAAGFDALVKAAGNRAELASLLLVTEQLPKLVEEQVKAISNLKIDKVTVWEGGKTADGKTQTAGFLSGLVGALPPLHELTKNVGIQLPEYLGKMTADGQPQAMPPATTAGEGGPKKKG